MRSKQPIGAASATTSIGERVRERDRAERRVDRPAHRPNEHQYIAKQAPGRDLASGLSGRDHERRSHGREGEPRHFRGGDALAEKGRRDRGEDGDRGRHDQRGVGRWRHRQTDENERVVSEVTEDRG
jgi:hypothetical protein